MEYRHLGGSGFKVPVLSFGTGTFGGKGEFFKAWGATDVKEATRLVDICLEAGLTMFDTADIYSAGAVRGDPRAGAIKGRRDKVLISTKATFRSGAGAERCRLVALSSDRAVESALKRLGTDYIDLFQLHGFDAMTPVEETLSTLDDLVRAGKIRYIGCSNFSGWHLMKSLAVAERYGSAALCRAPGLLFAGRPRLRMGADAARPRPGRRRGGLEPARLGPAHRQDPPRPAAARDEPPAQDRRRSGRRSPTEYLYRVVDALDDVAKETGKTVPQIALNWLLQRPTVATVIIGARNEEQLRQNLGAVGWKLTPEQVAKLDAASAAPLPIPTGTSAAIRGAQSAAGLMIGRRLPRRPPPHQLLKNASRSALMTSACTVHMPCG